MQSTDLRGYDRRAPAAFVRCAGDGRARRESEAEGPGVSEGAGTVEKDEGSAAAPRDLVGQPGEDLEADPRCFPLAGKDAPPQLDDDRTHSLGDHRIARRGTRRPAASGPLTPRGRRRPARRRA